VDEIDAFPFKDNELLQTFFKRSVKGHFVLLSATPSEEIKQMFSSGNHVLLELFSRYHGGLLPEPLYVIRLFLFKHIFLIKKLRQFSESKKPCFVFTPTIAICEELFTIIRMVCSSWKSCPFESERTIRNH
jgi:competence protein ComFA